VLREIEKPAVGDGDVLVRVLAAGVNSSDWYLMKRPPHYIAMLLRVPRTRIRGTDLAGHVEAVGRNVTRFKPGDQVFGAGLGSFAEYATSTERRLAPKPRNLTFEQAATLAVAGLTALQGLRDKACLRPGQRVLIYGAGGGVGTFAVQIAKAFGAEVTAVCSTRNTDMVRSIGADHVLDYSREDFAKTSQKFDLILAANGDRSIWDYRRALSTRGRYVMSGGSNRQLFDALLLGPVLSTGRRKLGNLLAKPNQADLLLLKDLIEAGKMRPVIERRYQLKDVPEAIRYLEAGHVSGKLVIDI
jgi:NADPH:quinone reductase-like Zn-dependent oxidoreductase